MATGGPHDPGGGDDARRQLTYADRLKTNVKYDERLKRNVLEIEIGKVEKEDDVVLDQQCVSRILTSIGINIKTDIRGYQLFYGRAIRISVWCLAGISLERFCRSEAIQVSKGVRQRISGQLARETSW